MRSRWLLPVLLWSCLYTHGSAAQHIPFVYHVENTGAECKLPPLPGIADLPLI